MHSIATVCIRAVGAFFALTYLGTFGMLLSAQLLYRAPDELELEGVAWPAAFVIVGIVLMMWSKNLARLLTAGVSQMQAPALDAKQLLQLGTGLLGVFFLAAAAPALASAVGLYLGAVHLGESAPDANSNWVRAGSSAFLAAGNAAAGTVLLWMARGLFAGRSGAAPAP
jgi:hypothetical protein